MNPPKATRRPVLPELVLRPARSPSSQPKWYVTFGGRMVSTGCGADELPRAEAALVVYVQRWRREAAGDGT